MCSPICCTDSVDQRLVYRWGAGCGKAGRRQSYEDIGSDKEEEEEEEREEQEGLEREEDQTQTDANAVAGHLHPHEEEDAAHI
jgi:hypothetical protein